MPSASPLSIHLLLSDTEALFCYDSCLPLASGESPVVALARVIAATAEWPNGCEAVLLARTAPPQLLVLGRFNSAAEAWLRCQSQALLHACGHLRYVDYPQAERDCTLLAALVREHLGAEELARAKFVAIPRGGHIVLGLLATLLNLDRDQMMPPYLEDQLLVVVDDCALSGTRFSQFLRGCGSSRVVFTPLYSHPELRAAIEAREPRVERVLSAADIQGERLDRGGARPEGEGYWTGTTEALAFPWNEPERSVWNPAAERWEAAWRVVPPELCLKNRPRPGSEPIPIQVHPAP